MGRKVRRAAARADALNKRKAGRTMEQRVLRAKRRSKGTEEVQEAVDGRRTVRRLGGGAMQAGRCKS